MIFIAPRPAFFGKKKNYQKSACQKIIQTKWRESSSIQTMV